MRMRVRVTKQKSASRLNVSSWLSAVLRCICPFTIPKGSPLIKTLNRPPRPPPIGPSTRPHSASQCSLASLQGSWSGGWNLGSWQACRWLDSEGGCVGQSPGPREHSLVFEQNTTPAKHTSAEIPDRRRRPFHEKEGCTCNSRLWFCSLRCNSYAADWNIRADTTGSEVELTQEVTSFFIVSSQQ